MTRRTRVSRSALAACLFVLAARPTHADSIPILNLDPTSRGANEDHYDGMVGWAFDLLQPVTVTQVGWYDAGQDGLSRDFPVGLWLRNGRNEQLLGDPSSGLVIPAGTSTALNGVFRVVDLATPLELQPGGYTLAGYQTATTSDTIRHINLGFNPDPTITGSRLLVGEEIYANVSSGFEQPYIYSLITGVELGPILFIAVPEPSSFGLLGTGLCLLLARRRLRAL